MVFVLVTLVGVNVYFLGMRGGTSIGALLKTTRVRSGTPSPVVPAVRPTAKVAPLPEDPPGAHLVEAQMADGQTVAQALTPRIGRRLAAQLEQTLGGRFDLGAVRAGQPYVLVYDAEDRLVAFELRAGGVTYRIELGARAPRLVELEGRADVRTVELVLSAGPGLWDGLRRAGEAPQLGEMLGELFSSEGELAGASTGSGDRVRVLVEKKTLGGRFQRYGRILAAEWVGRGGARRAFDFDSAFYTERGESLARRLRATPFRTSRGLVFTRRELQHLSDGRLLVEHGAPSGGGIAVAVAVGAGQVTALTRAPAGATVTLQLGEGERVTYAHLGKLARGLALGQKVEQGQALGRADGGVSLIYEGELARMVEGQSPRRSSLAAAERPRFGETIAPLLERLRALALRHSDRLAAGGLSAIP